MTRPNLLLGLFVLAGCTSIQLPSTLGEPITDPPGVPLVEHWERDVQAAFGPSAPLITRRYVVVGTRRGEVVVLDRETGATEGAGEFGSSVEGPIAVSADGGTIYVPTADADGGIEAYDVQQGRRVWRWEGGVAQAGVVRVGLVLVAPMLDSRVVALDAASGEVLWERAAVDGVQIHAAPVADGADVLIATDRGEVLRLAALSGAERWRADVGAPVYAAPAADGRSIVVSTTRGGVVHLDAASGEQRWRVDADRVLRATTAGLTDDALAVGFTDGSTRVYDRATGAERWRHRVDGNISAPPLWVDGHLAVGTMDRRLILLDAATGDEVWSRQLRGRVKSALGVGGGMLIALVEPRHVVAFQSLP